MMQMVVGVGVRGCGVRLRGMKVDVGKQTWWEAKSAPHAMTPVGWANEPTQTVNA